MKKILVLVIIVVALLYILREKTSSPPTSQNGISTFSFADDIISKYDENTDGKLDVAAESFLKTELDSLIKVESRGLLFTDVDAFGNTDGSVSRTELINYLMQFDTDNDGELTSFKNIFHSMFSGKSELANFDAKYGERFKYE